MKSEDADPESKAIRGENVSAGLRIRTHDYWDSGPLL